MSASVDITKFLAGLKKADQQIRDRARRALDQAGEHILGKAKECTPYDTGALQKSATAEPAQWSALTCIKKIGFNTRYAAIVHETWQQGKIRVSTRTTVDSRGRKHTITEKRGNKNAMARQKFLELAIRENAQKFNEFIRKAVAA